MERTSTRSDIVEKIFRCKKLVPQFRVLVVWRCQSCGKGKHRQKNSDGVPTSMLVLIGSTRPSSLFGTPKVTICPFSGVLHSTTHLVVLSHTTSRSAALLRDVICRHCVRNGSTMKWLTISKKHRHPKMRAGLLLAHQVRYEAKFGFPKTHFYASKGIFCFEMLGRKISIFFSFF